MEFKIIIGIILITILSTINIYLIVTSKWDEVKPALIIIIPIAIGTVYYYKNNILNLSWPGIMIVTLIIFSIIPFIYPWVKRKRTFFNEEILDEDL